MAGRDLFAEAATNHKSFAMFDKVNGTDATRKALQAGNSAAEVAASGGSGAAGNTIQLEDFKQNDPFSGYVTVKYSLQAPSGRLRARLMDSANPKSAQWFESEDVPIESGSGLKLVKFAVRPDATSPSDLFDADTIEIELLDKSGAVLGTVKKQTPMRWAKPK